MNTPQTPSASASKAISFDFTGPAVGRSLRFFFVMVLAVTAVTKLLDMPGFYNVVATYEVLPQSLIPASSWLLAVGELALAVWLLVGYRLRFAAALVILLHAMYLGWLLFALARGLELSNCGCFGVYFARPLQWYTPFEDLALCGLAFWLHRLQPRLSK